MTRKDLRNGVCRTADTLAYYYSRARYPIHHFSQGLAVSGIGVGAASGLGPVAKASLAEIDQAGADFVGLGNVLDLIDKEFGIGARDDARQVLNVFADLHKKVAELSVICITSERIVDDIATGAATDAPVLREYLEFLQLKQEKLIEVIAGFEGHEGPVDLVMTLAVNNLKASV